MACSLCFLRDIWAPDLFVCCIILIPSSDTVKCSILSAVQLVTSLVSFLPYESAFQRFKELYLQTSFQQSISFRGLIQAINSVLKKNG